VPFDGLTYFGLTVKPIVPNQYFGSGTERFAFTEFNADFSHLPGYSFGMIIRHELSPMWALETGISYGKRRFNVDLTDIQTGVKANMAFTLINYEVPLQALIYVRLRKRFYMNASAGLSFDAYPSNVETIQFDYEQRTLRRRWLQLALATNLGFEYRTKEKGYFYLGAGYHAPTDDIAVVRTRLNRDGAPYYGSFFIPGTYLTVDLKYFFHEDPYDSSNRPPRKKKKIGG